MDAFKEVRWNKGFYCLIFVIFFFNISIQLSPKRLCCANSGFFLYFNQEQVVASPEHEPAPTRAPETQPPAASPPAPEESDLTWEDKEDKLDAENIQPNPPEPTATDKKYQYKEGEVSDLCFSASCWQFRVNTDLISQ